MEIKTLGSVSPNSNGDKKGVGYLVKSGDYKVLLDAGSGITGLMNLDEDLNNLIIKISHLHADHIEELLALSYATYVRHNLGLLDERIKVYIPEPDYYYEEEHYGDNKSGWGTREVKKEIPVQLLLEHIDNHFEFITYDEKREIKHGDLIITNAKNPHDVKCYSTKLSDGNSSIVYSGDTGYKNNSLETFSKDADLLICESTFLKGQIRKGNNHLYAYEAGRIAKAANVKQLMLTHFWPDIDKQRYVDEAKEEFDNVIASKEGEVIKLGGIK